MQSTGASGRGPTRRRFLQAGGTAALTAASWQRIRGANERIGLGFIGYGLIGKRHLLDFQQEPDTRIVGVAEVHRGRLREALARAGVGAQGHRAFRRLLDDRNVNAVVIFTPSGPPTSHVARTRSCWPPRAGT